MNSPSFPKRDPAEAAFWDLRYEARFAPWDAGAVPERLRRFIATRAPARALVPGCGSAHEVRALAEARWDVLGIDFSSEAVAAARAALGPFEARVRQADFFAPSREEPWEFVYERAFLCALPPRLWTRWGERLSQVVAPGGLIAGFFFIVPEGPFDPEEARRGPPFPLHGQAELDALLEPHFERVEDEPVADSLAVFAGRERWQAWRRTGG